MISVRDIMRPMHVASPSLSAREADCLLSTDESHYLLVVDRDDLIGIACACDLMVAGRQARVASCMTVPVVRISGRASAHEAADLMRERGVGCLPVLSDDGCLLGGLTRRDLRGVGLPHEAVSSGPVCASCKCDQHVRSHDDLADFGFCRDCLVWARTHVPDDELGAGG